MERVSAQLLQSKQVLQTELVKVRGRPDTPVSSSRVDNATEYSLVRRHSLDTASPSPRATPLVETRAVGEQENFQADAMPGTSDWNVATRSPSAAQ